MPERATNLELNTTQQQGVSLSVNRLVTPFMFAACQLICSADFLGFLKSPKISLACEQAPVGVQMLTGAQVPKA